MLVSGAMKNKLWQTSSCYSQYANRAMHLTKLSVENWGVFRGKHDFNLTPSSEADGTRRLVTFIGHNGAGKTTLFQSIQIALYGSLALGDRVSQQAYSERLSRSMHRYSEGEKTIVSKTSSIQLSFEYVQRGVPLQIEIVRHWAIVKNKVQESLQVLCNGQVPDIEPSDYQHWLLDIIPFGFNSLCFFDTERMDSLTDLDQHSRLLQESLRRLLGLDMVERLQNDLDHYIIKKGAQKEQQIQVEIVNNQSELDGLNIQIENIQMEVTILQKEYEELERTLLQHELRLAAEGGTYAEKRSELYKRLKTLDVEIDTESERLRDMCSQLLPFALAPALCQTLHHRLGRESNLRRLQIIHEFWREKAMHVQNTLQEDDFWKHTDMQPESRNKLTQRLLALLQEGITYNGSANQSLVHDLAEPVQEKLIDWINQALGDVSDQAKQSSARLRNLRAEKRQVEKDLQRAPDDDVLAPIYAEITKIKSAIEDMQRRRDILNEQLGALRFQRDEKTKHLQRLTERLIAIQANERQLTLAQKSKAVLRTYEDMLLHQHTAALSKDLVQIFNFICQKEHLLSEAYIDPVTFRIQLCGQNGRVLTLQELAAGEVQIFGMALLLALRQISKRRFPLLIDTPVARLDETHRRLFFQKYIPMVNEQVLLFMTEAELDDNMMAMAKPHLAHHYRLTHNEQVGYTSVHYNGQPVQAQEE